MYTIHGKARQYFMSGLVLKETIQSHAQILVGKSIKLYSEGKPQKEWIIQRSNEMQEKAQNVCFPSEQSLEF